MEKTETFNFSSLKKDGKYPVLFLYLKLDSLRKNLKEYGKNTGYIV